MLYNSNPCFFLPGSRNQREQRASSATSQLHIQTRLGRSHHLPFPPRTISSTYSFKILPHYSSEKGRPGPQLRMASSASRPARPVSPAGVRRLECKWPLDPLAVPPPPFCLIYKYGGENPATPPSRSGCLCFKT